MSDRTNTSAPQQPQTPAPEQQPPAATPEQTAPAAPPPAEQTAEQPPAPAATLQQANATLAKFAAECRSSTEANYRLGALAAEYVEQFLAASDKAQRETAVENLAAEWRQWDEDSMAVPLAQAMKRLRERVNVLLRTTAAVRLFGDGRGLAKGDGTGRGRGKGKAAEAAPLPWGKVRELCVLVERQHGRPEQWAALSPDVQTAAVALVAECATSGLKREDLVAAVAKLVEQHAAAKRELAEQQAAEQRAAAVSTQQAAAEQAAAVAEAAAAAEEAARAAGQAKAEDKARLTAAAEAAKAKLLAEQQEASRTQAEAALAAQKAAEQDKAAAEAARKQAEAEGKAAAKAQKATAAPAPRAPAATAPQPPAEAAQGTNLLAVAKTGAPKDVAGMAAELVTGGDAPDDVLHELLLQLRDHKQLCKASHRAIQAALLVLTRAQQPAVNVPIPTADANGRAVAVA